MAEQSKFDTHASPFIDSFATPLSPVKMKAVFHPRLKVYEAVPLCDSRFFGNGFVHLSG
jgi:hypothetical protein